jgi:polyphosphate kinase 2 (PPK2 family)
VCRVEVSPKGVEAAKKTRRRDEVLGEGHTATADAAQAKPQARMKRKQYERELRRPHGELVAMQAWVKASGAKVCVVFEGRDTAGKGGTIKAITERVSPWVFRVVALPAPTGREQSQMYLQRYIPHLPAGGEVVIFDRSWYDRAGVERVMGFCPQDQVTRFLQLVPGVEKAMVDSGIVLVRYWLGVSQDEQTAGSRAGSTTHASSGSSRRWTSSPTAVGTTIHAPATTCSPLPTPPGRRGMSQTPTTSEVAGSTSSPTCSTASPTSHWSTGRSRCPNDGGRRATPSRALCLGTSRPRSEHGSRSGHVGGRCVTSEPHRQ